MELQFNWPNRKNEDWRYHSLKIYRETHWTQSEPDQVEILNLDPRVLVTTLTDVTFAKTDSVNISRFQERFSEYLNRHVLQGALVASFADSFSELRKQISGPLLLIEVPAGVCIEEPLVLRIKSSASRGLRAPRICLQLGQGSQLPLLEIFENAEGDSQLSLPELQGVLETGSRLEWTRVSVGTVGFSKIAASRVFLESDAELESLSVAYGSQLVRENLDVHLVGTSAKARLHGVSITGGSDVVDHHTTIDHVVGGCETTQLYKGILSGNSRSIFNGRVVIRHNAQKANSDQLNQNLLLSSSAEIDSKPQLEIHADDVKATHGSSIGHLNEEEIFYLVSRGIPRAQAESMIRSGFTTDLLLRISNSTVREQVLSMHSKIDQRYFL